MRIVLIIVILVLAFAGCADDAAKGGGEVGDPKTVVLSPGSGQENVEPLWPLVIGARRVHGGGDAISIPDRTQKFGKVLYRFQGSTTVRFYEQNSEGVFSAGSINLGALPREVLLVPAKVKVGMKWQSYTTGDTPAITSTVTGMVMKDTLFGPRKVWNITQTDEVSHITYSTDFAEGRGPIEADHKPALLSILPLDPEPALQPNKRLALTSLDGGKPVFANFWATTAGAVVDQSGKANIRIGGQMVWYKNTDGVGVWTLAPQTGCALTTDGFHLSPGMTWADTSEDGKGKSTDPSCPEASAALFNNGSLEQIELRADGTQSRAGDGLHVNAAGVPEPFHFESDQYGTLIWYVGGTSGSFGVDARINGGGLWRPWASAGTLQRVLVDVSAPADDFGFAAIFGDRVLGASVKDKNISPLTLVAGVPGAHVSAKTTAAGREHYLVSADGVIDRLHIGVNGVVTVERYAELDLPARHELIGVIPFADHLLVLALTNREEFFPFKRTMPLIGDVVLFSAPLPAPATAGAFRSDLPHNGITAEILDNDLKVCWPSAAGAAITAGWTLGGQPVTAMPAGADGSCVLLLRAAIDKPLIEGAYAAEGPIPGVGRVAIGVHTPTDHTSTKFVRGDFLAPLASGGMTSVSMRLGAAGDVIGVPDRPVPEDGAGLLVRSVDPAGLGVWWPNSATTARICGGTADPAAVLIGETSHCLRGPAASAGSPAASFSGIAAWGIAVWSAFPKYYLLKLDGSSQEVTGLVAGDVVGGVLADGTACGSEVTGSAPNYRFASFCAKDGVVTRKPLTLDDYGKIGGPWLATAAGFYPKFNTNEALFFDPATQQILDLDYSAVGDVPRSLKMRVSSDGKLFAFYDAATAKHLVEIDRNLLKLADPVRFASHAATTTDFAVTSKMFIVMTSESSPNQLLRLPRP